MRDRLSGLLPLLCAIVLALQASLPFRSPERTLSRPLTEDGYYALTIARNIATGHGATIDGQRPTNGFQPLFVLLTVPLFWIAGGDPIRPLRGLLFVHLVVQAATAMLLASIGRDAARGTTASVPRGPTGPGPGAGDPRGPTGLGPGAGDAGERSFGWLVAFLYLVSVGTFLQHWNGLETGFYLFMLVLAWRVYERLGDRPGAEAVLGLCLGLVVLTRIDAAILVAIVAAGEALRRDPSLGASVRRAATLAAVAACVSLPWWIYSLRGFGSLMPTSGRAQQEFGLSAERIERAFSAWLADAVPWWYARRGGGLVADVPRLALLVILARLRPWRVPSEDAGADRGRVARIRRFGVYCVLFSLALAIWYCASSWATHWYVRYLAPVIPCATLAFAFGARRGVHRAPLAAAAAAVALVGFMGYVTLALHQGRVFGPNVFHDQQLALIEAHVPKGEWVAAGQTGTIGYFREHVLNLDGKVNPEAYAARHDIAGYLERQNVRWFCDWPMYQERWLGARPEARGWRRIDQRGEFLLYAR